MVLSGADIFSREHDIPCIGIPGTIDKETSLELILPLALIQQLIQR
jgi:hypothetical protein